MTDHLRIREVLDQMRVLSDSLNGVIYSADEKPRINSPLDAARLLLDMHSLQQEQIRVIILNTRNEVIRVSMVYQGSVNSTQVRIAELFRDAIMDNAPAIIVIHNHPSGDTTPSPDDVAITRAVVQAGQILDIDVLDHLILGGGRHVSLKERGLGFN
jgi:DNA repair protein RadC